jgi:hypothetical protein
MIFLLPQRRQSLQGIVFPGRSLGTRMMKIEVRIGRFWICRNPKKIFLFYLTGKSEKVTVLV